MGNTKGTGGKVGKGGCSAILGIGEGYLVFAPNRSGQGSVGSNSTANDFCQQLKKSYQSSGGYGNKVIPLASSGTVEF